MSHAERRKNRKVKLVGGGYKWTRESSDSGGSIKSRRRSIRRSIRDKRMTPSKRRALKEQLRETLLRENEP